MNKILLFLSFLFLSVGTFAQNITYSDGSTGGTVTFVPDATQTNGKISFTSNTLAGSTYRLFWCAGTTGSNPLAASWRIGAIEDATSTDCAGLQSYWHIASTASTPPAANAGWDDDGQGNGTLVLGFGPTLTSIAVTPSGTSVTLGGNISNTGTTAITGHGVVYGNSANPAIGGSGVTSQTIAGTATGAYSNTYTLSASTTYHYRAWASNGSTTSYGADISFTTGTAAAGPTVTSFTGVGTASGNNLTNLPIAGGGTVTITGTNFASGMTISAGASGAVTYVSATSATFTLASGTAGSTLTPTVTVSGQTSTGSATLTYASIPAAPTLSAATSVSASGFTVNWGAVTNATSYQIDVSTSNTFTTFVSGFQNLAVASGTSQAVTGLSSATTYYYRVRTVSNGGTSVSSSTGNQVTSAATPTITATGTLAAVNTTYGTASATPTSFSVSGSNLIANLVVTPPTTDFEVSTSSGSGYGANVSLTPSSGTVATTTVYLRLKATTVVGTYGANANVSIVSTGAAGITLATASSTVSKAALTITAANQSKTYGASLPTLTATYSGFVNSETSTVLTTAPTLSTTATSASHVAGSPYAITASGAAASNYSISYVAGTLTVTTAPLTITANNQTKTYGAALPTLTASYTGFVNGDASSNLTTAPTLSTTATATSSVAGSPYSITANGAADADYSISYVAGSLTITTAPLTITAANKSKVYGAALPTLTATYTGFVNGDTNTSLTTQPTLSTTATTASHVAGSPYSITASGAASSNYSITYVAGTLTVTTAPLTITADNQSKAYGAALPTLTASYTGFVNGDASSNLTTAPTLSTTATATSSVAGSPYSITGSGAVDADYSISYVAGNLTVTGIPLTITAANKTKVYGAALPTLTATYTGFVNGDTNASLTTQPTLSTTATSASHISGSPYAITASGAASSNYTISYVSGTLTVTAAPLTITANNQSKAYGASLPTLTASYSGFVNGDTNASLTTQPTLSTTATAASGVAGSPYGITASGAVGSDYSISYVAGTLSVTTVTLTITAANQTKIYGAALPALTATYTGFVNGDTNSSLTTQPTISTTATSASSVAGSPYTISASGAASSNYTISYVAGALTVTGAPLTITANNVNKAPGATLTSGSGSTAFTTNPVTLPNSDAVSSVTITYGSGAAAGAGAGTYPGSVVPSAATGITASNYTITYTAGDIVIGNPSVTASGTLTAVNTTYGTASATPASFTVSGTSLSSNLVVTPPSGFEVSTASGSGYGATVSLTPASSTVASTTIYIRLAATTGAGTYGSGQTVSVTSGTSTQTLATAASTVSKAALTITAANQTKVYSAALPTLTATYSGFVNSETSTVLTTAPTLSTTATAASHVAGSPYSITPSGAAAANYTISYVAGTLAVTTAPLTITAANQTKTYGDVLPALTASYTGFVNGDTQASLTTQPTLSTTATTASGVAGSPYAIAASGALDADYSISYVAGTLTVTQAPLTVTADNQSKAYGAALPTLTASATGFVNGDTQASLTTQPTINTTATAASSVAGSPYAINASGAASPNYTISYIAGTLTVTGVPLTITAANITKVYGAAVPTLTATYTGFVNGDTNASLTTQPTLSTTATSASHISGSPYAITASGAASSNYTISYVSGTLTVTTAPLTITANNQSKTYGDALPTLTASYTGFVNGDTQASLTTQPTLSTTATTTSGVAGSPYAITASNATGADYSISYIAGTLTVTQAALAITANNVNKTQGTTITGGAGSTAFTNNPTNLPNSETVGSVTITYGTGAASGAATGTYTGSVVPSLATGGTFTASNYNITYSNGDIIVGSAQAAVTVSGSLSAVNTTYGTASATPTSFSVSGTNLAGNLVVSPPSGFEVSTSSGSGYGNTANISPSGGTVNSTTIYLRLAATTLAGSYSGNVSITSTGATTQTIATTSSTVSKATLTITANNQTKVYGAGLPTLTASYSGFVNGENSATLTTAPTLSTTAITASHVSGSPYAITASGAAAANYTISYVAGSLSITSAPLTITADNQSKVYGAVLPTLTASYTGFVNGDTGASLTTAPTLSTTATSASSVAGSPYAITPSAAVDADYNISYVAGNLSVTSTPLTITVNNQSKVYGAALPTLTATYTGFVNGDTQASLTTQPTLSTTATSASSVASSPYAITASGAVSSNYTISYVAGTLTVTKAALTVTADNQSKAYGAAIPTLTASYSGFVNGDTQASLTTQPTLSTTATSASSVAGNPYAITVSGAVNPNYTISNIAGTLTVTKAVLAITANNQSKVYGAVLPTLTASYSGFVNGDTQASLTTQPTLSTTATSTSTVAGNPYSIIASGAVSSNYTISYVAGSLTVTQAALTITADNKSKVYGAALPVLTATYSGFVNGDTNASLTTQPTLATTATVASPVNTYPVTASGAVNPNYSITYPAGILTVTPAALTITADNKSKVYGAILPTLTASYSGFVNGDTNTSLTTQPTLVTTATTASPVNTYPITASGAASSNYSITYSAGTLTIAQAVLTITANNQTKVYGAALPTLTATYTGFVNGDTPASLTTPPTLGTTATASSSVGGSPYAITIGGAVSSNYTINYVAGTLTVTQAVLTITADNKSKVYGAANPTLTASYSGFVNGDTNASLTTQPTIATTATVASPVNTYPISVSGAVSGNYTINYIAGTLTVTPATLTITADNKSKVYGASLPTLTASYSGFVNGDTNASLTTQPTLTTTATVASPVNTYPISVSGAVSTNYTITYTAGTLTVTQAALTITADNKSKVYGAVLPTLTASYGGFVNGDTNASLTTQPVLGTTATAASAVNTYPITAGGAVNPNYLITYTAGTLTVTQAALTITADNKSKVYGSANPTLTASYSGFVNGDTNTSLTTQPTLSTTATTSSAVNTYPITASGAVSGNYSITYTAGTLTVTQAALTITADNKSKVYGAANPTLTASYSGFVNGDSNASLTTQPTIATTATVASPVNTYPISVSGAVSGNYTINYIAGTLTVTPATLTITADNKSKVYGASLPTLTASYSGFVNGDTNASLTTQPTIATTATVASPVNTYPISVSGAVSGNYAITYAAGTLTVTQAALTITADNKSKIYGAALPTLTASYSGFVNGDTNASLTTQPTLSTTATASSAVNTYPITASGAVSANYTIAYTSGTLTVTQATLLITADNKAKVYGSANPTLTASYSGFVNGDTNTSLTTQPAIATTATASSAVNTYPISISGAVNPNYIITYTAGTLTVTQAVLTITASNQTKVYGSANPTLTASYNGFVNGDTNSSLTTQAALATTATAGSAVNTYPITVTGATSANYTINFVAGTLTVTKAALTITADNKSRLYGVSNPVFTGTYAGFVNGDTPASLTTGPVFSSSTSANTAPGNYPVSASGAISANYTISYVNGILTIIPLSNANLLNLSISDGKLSPVFATATKSYTDSVTYATDYITLVPTIDPTAKVTINGLTAYNGSTSGNIQLNTGFNTIIIVVTAQDGVTQLTYTVTVYKGVSFEKVSGTNILTPNGDGKNDTWVVKDILLYPNNNVTVYDRAGRIVFSRHGYTNDWDGTLKGLPLAEGTYYTIVDLGLGSPVKGFITILRNR